MHRIYTSEAIVLGSRSYGEADKVVTIFTREYGLMRALAKSVRKETSKLRYSLTDRSIILVSLVRGREFWRLISAVPQARHRGMSEGTKVVARVSLLIKRLMPPETPEPHLFDTLLVFIDLAFSDASTDLSTKTDIQLLEMAMVLHILKAFGYLGNNPVFEAFLEKPFAHDSLQELIPHKKIALEAINNALHHSHL